MLRVAEGGSVAFERAYNAFSGIPYSLALRILERPDGYRGASLQEVFKKICTDAADYDLRRWLGQLRFTRRHQASQ